MAWRNSHSRSRFNRNSEAHSNAGFAAGMLRGFASLLLTLCLLSSATPAAPQTIRAVVTESSVGLAFWLRANGLPGKLWRALSPQQGSSGQETQAQRDARVVSLRIYPGDVTIQFGQQVNFTAVPLDQNGVPVGGVKVQWSALRTSNIALTGTTISTGGVGLMFGETPSPTFKAVMAGVFQVTATAAGKSAQAKVIVPQGLRPNPNETPIRTVQVSTRDLPSTTTTPVPQTKNRRKRQNSPSSRQSQIASAKIRTDRRSAHASSANTETSTAVSTKTSATEAAMPISPDDGWSPNNYWSADDPPNRRGDPPGAPLDGGAGSGNFQFAAPVYSSSGRGINISLGLAYNSRLWNKAGSQINFDIDRDWPAPGFNLGFGRLLGMGVYNGGMLVDADGTRHGYTGTVTGYSWGTTFVGHTTDGSFIDYSYTSGTGGGIVYAQARLANGTLITYGVAGPGAVYPTNIQDANGNYITITYVNNTGPQIQTVTDTLGRFLNFYYDGNNLLTAINAPGLNGGVRTLVRLHYRQLFLSYSFSGLTPIVRDSYPWVVDAIYYPATNIGYWFGDGDSYSSYGMLAKVVEQRGMGFSAASLTDQGTVTQGQMTQQAVYNYPLSTSDPGGSGLSDAPTYTSMIQTWTRDGVNTDQATTTYGGNQNANPRTVSITLPNGTTSTQYSYNAPGSFLDGLVYLDETRDSATNLLQGSSSAWEQGAYNSPRPTRATTTDERGQVKAAEFSYGSSYNQVTEVRDYDYGGVTLRRTTRAQYQNSASYINRHIFNLPLVVEVFAPDAVTRVSRTDYQYDSQPLFDAPNVVMHDDRSNPYAPPVWIDGYWDEDCSEIGQPCRPFWVPGYWQTVYDPSTDFRGNVTLITRYADSVGLTSPVTETRRYDIAGNMVTADKSCCQQTSFGYTIDTQYAYPLSKTQGSASDGYAQVTTNATYDFNTDLSLSATDPNGRQSQTSYDAGTLRPLVATEPTGAHTDHGYDDTAMTVTQTTYLSPSEGGGIADKSVKVVNGLGKVRQEQALGAGNVWDFVDTVYDNMGRVSQQTRPYRSGETQQWTTTTYDALSREIAGTAPDGSTTQTLYNETARPDVASGAPGETTRARDAWGRERWGRTDASGRLVEVVEPNPSGDGSVANSGLVTTYGYDTLGNLTTVNQGAQTRSFRYDALGRLIAQKLAEASATLNDAGTYVGSGTWSDVFTYDDSSNLISRTDARGVKTVYTYNSDPLNRLQSVSWDTSGFGDTTNPILATATVTYGYRPKSSASQLLDVTQLNSVTASGVSTESYNYDSEGRVSSQTLTLASRSSYPMATDFSYDSLDRVTDVSYPAEYGNGSAPRKVVHHDYDIASRLTQLTMDGQAQASNIVYNAASQTTSLVAGGSTANPITESYNYNPQTGLLENQTVTRGGTTLLNLGYEYTNSSGKRTGQLTKISNNLDHNRDRGYEYDSLGRLQRATGGQNVNCVQRYNYDRYGNRTDIFSYTAEQLVRNFYQSALNRQPNSTELQNWLSSLQTAYSQGQTQLLTAMQSLGETLFSSTEYANRNRSDHDYVYDLYEAYLLRGPDPGGWAFWESQVPVNGRAAVRAGFAWSSEFSLTVNGTSPYSPPGGATVPADGLTWMGIDGASNRLNGPGFAYDAAGNQTRALTAGGSVWQRFQYDAANRLVKVKADDNVSVLATYTYGCSNERFIAEEGGLRTYYVWSGNATIAEFTESGGSTTPSWSKSYVYLGERLLSTLTPNGGGGEAVQYHHPDRLGTRLVTTPADGTSFEQVTLPFGTPLNSESTGATNRRFTSYDRSATTGLDYAVNRHYDSQQGRFTQVDPAAMKATSLESPQTLNLYAYCTNDPVNHTDQSGLGFFSFLKRLFKAIGKILTAVGNAIARVLNNRWVRIGVFILGFILPGLHAISTLLYKIVDMGLRIYNYVADIGAQLQLAGELLSGHIKEFFTNIGIAIIGAAVSEIVDPIVTGLRDSLFAGKNILKGAWNGFLDGLHKFGENMTRRLIDMLTPFYGIYGGGGNPPDSAFNPNEGTEGGEFDPNLPGIDDTDNNGYKLHDTEGRRASSLRDKLKISNAEYKERVRLSDRHLLKNLLRNAPMLHLLDIAFAGHPGIGSGYKFLALNFFSVRYAYATFRK